LPDVEVTAATETWLNGQPSEFFPSLVAVARFFPGQAKDLSAPRYGMAETESNML